MVARMGLKRLKEELLRCRLCEDRFAATRTAHNPRPVIWFEHAPRILVAGQAPGAKVHESGKPFTDPSGDRLRDWLGVTSEAFYDRSKFALIPMAFCFPGYDAKGSDLPPPTICAKSWRDRVMSELGRPRLTLLVGGYAQKWHLQTKAPVTDTVAGWRDHAPRLFPLPHPSWRNTAWMKRNQWFEAETLPALKTAVQEALQ